jgi:hypothetical protein
MKEMIINELSQALHELARGFAHYLPRLIVMLILAFAGWAVAYVVKVLLRSLLRLPRLFAALFILFFGLLAAGFFSRAALLAAVNANVPSPRVLSFAVRSIIIVFVLSIVFEELGLAEQTMLVAFGIVFGALMLGLAIAFGLGGRDLAQGFLERRFLRPKKEEGEDELSPL